MDPCKRPDARMQRRRIERRQSCQHERRHIYASEDPYWQRWGLLIAIAVAVVWGGIIAYAATRLL